MIFQLIPPCELGACLSGILLYTTFRCTLRLLAPAPNKASNQPTVKKSDSASSNSVTVHLSASACHGLSAGKRWCDKTATRNGSPNPENKASTSEIPSVTQTETVNTANLFRSDDRITTTLTPMVTRKDRKSTRLNSSHSSISY